MFYNLVRMAVIAIVCLLSIGVLYLFRKKMFSFTKRRVIFLLISVVLGYCLLSLLPFENLFVEFSSPEAAFQYESSGSLVTTIDGDKSTLIIFKERDGYSFSVYPKGKNGWKLPQVLSQDNYSTRFESSYMSHIQIFSYQNTNESFIILNTHTNDPAIVLDIQDTQGSEFDRIVTPIGMDWSTVIYYAVVSSPNPNYKITVNGQEKTINLS